MYHRISDALEDSLTTGNSATMEATYRSLDSISIDNAILEKSGNICVIKGKFSWEDIGSLGALEKLLCMDSNGNAVKGPFCSLDTNSSIIYSDTGIVATVGLENCIVINSGNVVLVCPKEKSQQVRNLVEKLMAYWYMEHI